MRSVREFERTAKHTALSALSLFLLTALAGASNTSWEALVGLRTEPQDVFSKQRLRTFATFENCEGALSGFS
jgi:hypothetical protein